MTGTRTRGGFVFRAIDGLRDLFDHSAAVEAADYVPLLVRQLFDDVLGYDDIAYSQREQWREVTFVDDEGQPAVVLAAAAPGEDLRAARRRALDALADEPAAHYAVATNRDRLAVLACCPAGHPDATERRGVATRELTAIDLRATVERAGDRSIAEALTPGQQLSVAKLTALQRAAVSSAPDDPAGADGEPTFGGLATADDSTAAATPETLAETLTEVLAEILRPAVSAAFERLSHRIQEFADREAEIEARIEDAKAAGDEPAVTSLRADLFELREAYATARRLEAGFARWRRVVDETEAAAVDRFAAESAAVALDTLLLARVAADRGLAGDLGDYREFWADRAEHAERDATDMVRAVREELAGVSAGATDDGTFAWVFEADLADAFADAVGAISAVDVGDLDARELTAAFESHLDADARPVRGATRPSTAGLLLDRAGYTADATIDDAESDLLDPACGDGSLLVGAADRLLDRLGRTDATAAETLSTVRDRLHGVDRHPYAVHLTESRLLLRTVDVHADATAADDEFSLGRFGVYRADALRAERESYAGAVQGERARRREQAAAVRSSEAFGFVASDAPTDSPEDAPGAVDANAPDGTDRSALFLDRAADWLAPGGRLSMAVDGSLLTAEAAAGARSRLAAAFRLRELVEFDTGSGAMPLFVAAERDGDGAADAFTYARVTPTFLDLVREGLIRPGTGEATTPAELLSRSLPAAPGGDPPPMTTVLVELDLVCDATVEGAMPVEVRSVDRGELTDGAWTFAAGEESATDERGTDGLALGSPHTPAEE
ncbi:MULTISPECIES: hypothetical protein [Halolamina]|uniref:Type I restriction-modification system methyltransferase subunit n=1 Tax=Halolamina pelagica TaxID=699431 RepID=A0A1I5MBL8_9EURY|nr:MULTISPECIES: hypothetical protein [Halolamina]NHX35934.1 hypothetical protein [Halolamina sp. R1-12]SFP06401.1 hypothetical protein SAMN05216277_101175 [Halolamina pelagica]